MSRWTPISPWKPIEGSGQSLALTATTAASFANAVGKQTYAVAISLAPQATASGALIRISNADAAATATGDYFIKTTDQPQILGCNPGDSVSVYPLANGTAYLTEMTH